MGYLGNSFTQQTFTPTTDFFSGNGATTTFTLTRPVQSVYGMEVVVNNVRQNPSNTYTINAAGQIVFIAAPSVGTNNIYVSYNSPIAQITGLGQGIVTTQQLGSVSNINSVNSNLTLQTNGSTVLTLNATSGAVSTVGNLGVGTLSPAYSIDAGSRTDALLLPKGTTAQRPAGTTSTGALRYNTTINQPEVWNGNLWTGVVIANADGSSAAASGVSAQAIKTLTGTTTSGYYWITVGGAPTQVWCDMSGATAWMLLMRLSSGGTTFSYDSAYWQNTTGLNATSDPLTNTDIKNGQMWAFANITTMRLTGSTNTTLYNANPLTFGSFNATANTIFNAGSNTWDAQVGYTRAEWLAWGVAACGNVASNFDTQPNCNTTTINNTGTGPYARVRIGWCGNNENDCGTNDSWVGPGGYYNGSQLNGGAQSWTPTVYTPAHMWLWTNSI